MERANVDHRLDAAVLRELTWLVVATYVVVGLPMTVLSYLNVLLTPVPRQFAVLFVGTAAIAAWYVHRRYEGWRTVVAGLAIWSGLVLATMALAGLTHWGLEQLFGLP